MLAEVKQVQLLLLVMTCIILHKHIEPHDTFRRFLYLMMKHHVVVSTVHELTFMLFFTLTDVCNVPYETGPCRGYFQKWYYNPSLRGCQEFVYGGCRGNGNRFSSLEECERICLHHEELLPPGNDTALSQQGTEFHTGSNGKK